MSYTYRHLPHWIPEEVDVFVTWRLAGSLPCKDEELDRDVTGPRWLQGARIAQMIADALLFGEKTRHLYDLHAWVIMPNHVHIILRPRGELASILRWLKSRTGRVANRILGRTGMAFWQDESYDHWVRTTKELEALIAYVENNPVNAALVEAPDLWHWSSACGKTDDKIRSPVLLA
ncbi:conserved hypothetical protein [Candidatus Sulfopaludibacter sp. SbA3]|nr:conserved hypothetical protein [Candidatus Sulfopaludibacter sp. SbA3]